MSMNIFEKHVRALFCGVLPQGIDHDDVLGNLLERTIC